MLNTNNRTPSLAKKVVAGVVATAAVCLLGYAGVEMMKEQSTNVASVQSFDTLTAACGGADDQCGGEDFKGAPCCLGGYTCNVQNQWHSQCEVDFTLTGCNFNWEQCGGTTYTGSNPGVCCGEDFTCYAESAEYSQCRPTGDTFPPFTYSPTSVPTAAPTEALTPSPTASPTTAGCVANWGKCGGIGYSGTGACCDSGYSCYAQNEWYSQCRPTGDTFPPFTYSPTSAPTGTPTVAPPTDAPTFAPTESTPSPTASPTTAGCVANWEECGGIGYSGTGACCDSGYSCYAQNEWYSQCRPTGDAFPPFTYSPTSAPTGTPTVAPPTDAPTKAPTKAPTNAPTKSPTKSPTFSPTFTPGSCTASWNKCGGKNSDGTPFTGSSICCESGFTCIRQNEWYSQCRNQPF